MSIKQILVHLDCSKHSLVRLEYAAGLANYHRAELRACLGMMGADQNDQERIHETFLKLGSDLKSQWLNLEGANGLQELTTAICRLGQSSDLIIVGQPDHRADAGVPRELPEKVVLLSGRPVLILPYAGQFDPICQRALVAWNGGRESVRALHDALPLLNRARQVHLLSLMKSTTEAAEMKESLDLLSRHLEHHGVSAQTETLACAEVSKGDMLLNRCAEEGSDLLVAGCYYREKLGEVGRHLMKYMTVPVLMSH